MFGKSTAFAADFPNILHREWHVAFGEQHTKSNGFFEKNRNEQNVKIFYDWIDFTIKNNFFNNPDVQTKIDELLPMVLDGRITPYQAGNAVTMTED